jgi:SnoaL-like domain
MRAPRYLVALMLAMVMGSTVVTVQAQDPARGAKKLSTEERLRRMEDMEAIRTLLVSYGRNFDKRDFTAYSNLFAKEGVWTGGAEGTQSYKGPEAIRAMVEKGYQPTVFPGSYHIMSSFDIRLESADTASAWSRWTFVVRGVHNEPVLFRGGYYEDALVREDGVWKFQSRRVLTDPPNK